MIENQVHDVVNVNKRGGPSRFAAPRLAAIHSSSALLLFSLSQQQELQLLQVILQ
jgi:hypothetical protein